MSITGLLPSSLGFGTAPLGNMFRYIPDWEAAQTIQAAWDHGIRYFDTAPLYGAGLAEIRLGRVLSDHPREEFVISTKVGRMVSNELRGEHVPDRGAEHKDHLFADGLPYRVVDDYSASAAERSIEDSLERLGTDYLDIAWVHDVGQDYHGDTWLEKYEIARTGAFRTLTRLRDEGVIRAWGVAVNRVEPLEITLSLDEPQPDALLLAGRYTLLDHATALQRLLPQAQAQGVDIVVGGPYSSGALVGGATFEYQQTPPEIAFKVARIAAVAEHHSISVKSAALQFVLAHPAVAAVIPGASRPARIAEDVAAAVEVVPPAFWDELRDEGLISPHAPVPVWTA
ncbi:aldo/keto reductase [Rhodococcus sp. ABRD24]|uniref:aldo/keto reductase n=1 Tax=Rhodococcus sp. ABRD24 TaxID=2507582 RepID=UPI00103C6BB4|nr:aldo/keto reductase [Rhodococcus sp. ABRD24]QBJ96609.1 aldo/keto reductase [Rhodococcus sp. ABRD24]